MGNVRSYTNEDILNRVESLSTFKGWLPGIYEINVRSTEDEYDAFDDKAYLYEVGTDGKPKFVMVRNVTTNTGSYGLKNFKEYNHLGAAVLKSDWMIYGSHTYGLHRGKKPAYRQAKSWPHFRDNNRNNKAEEIGKEHSGIIGANIHRAGVDSTVIKNWSTACLVTATESKFLAFLAFMKSKGNPPLNVAILKEFDPKTTKKVLAAQSQTNEAGDSQPGPDLSASEPVSNLAGDSPPIVQNAEQIINTGDASNTPAPEDKTMEAPSKDGATATSTKVTIAGIVVPGFIVSGIAAVKQWVAEGYISAADVGSTILTFIRENQKYVFLLSGLIIVLLIVKKLVKQITFWLQMISQIVPHFNNVTVIPATVEEPTKRWWRFWK